MPCFITATIYWLKIKYFLVISCRFAALMTWISSVHRPSWRLATPQGGSGWRHRWCPTPAVRWCCRGRRVQWTNIWWVCGMLGESRPVTTKGAPSMGPPQGCPCHPTYTLDWWTTAELWICLAHNSTFYELSHGYASLPARDYCVMWRAASVSVFCCCQLVLSAWWHRVSVSLSSA